MRLTATRSSITSGGGAVLDPITQEDPSLDLQFAENKNLTNEVDGDNLVTFTRASSGTYVDGNGIVQSATTNTPRFDHDPATGESLGLLIEEARTNLISYSDDLSNSWWDKTNVTTASIAASNPFNYSQVYRVRATTIDNNHRFQRLDSTLVSANTDHTFSLFAAPEGTGSDSGMIQLRIAYLGFSAAIVNFNLNTGQANAQGGTSGTSSNGDTWSISDYGMEPFAGGWYRVWMTYQASVATSAMVVLIDDINASDVGSIYTYTGSGTGGSYFAGIQVEEGSFKTSVIPTSGTTVTRAADVAEITGTNFSGFYNQSEGTIFAEYNPVNIVTDDSYAYELRTDIDNRIASIAKSDRNNAGFVVTAGVLEAQIAKNTGWVNNQYYKTAFGVASNNVAMFLDGAQQGSTDTSVTLPTVNTLNLGRKSEAPTYHLNGHIKRFAYFNTRLPDATLQSITS